MSSLMLAIVLLPLVAAAEDAPKPTPSPKPAACAAPEQRQFDFWIGDWDVTTSGKRAGESHVEKILAGCVIFDKAAK